MRNSLVALVCLAAGTGASASITGVTGMTTWLGSPPVSCMPGALSGVNAYTWDEQQNTFQSLIADMVNNPGNSGGPIPGPLTGNYDSHFIHFESTTGAPAVGSVTFSTPIVGVIFRPLTLDITDVPAGSPGTVYPTTFPFRAVSANSFFSILGNTISFNIAPGAAPGVGQIRVLTQVPAPGSAALMGMGALALGRRRRR